MFQQLSMNQPGWLVRLSNRQKIPRRWWYPELNRINIDDNAEWKRQNDEVSNTIRRTVLTLVIYSAFCIIMLGAPDATLLSASENINLPFTNTEVSYQGFLIFGPLILIGLSIYLHVNLHQLYRFEHEPGKYPLPFIFNQKNTSASVVSSIIFYWLVPIVLLTFSWKTLPRSGIAPALLILLTALFTCSLVWVQIRRLKRGRKWFFRLRMLLSMGLCLALLGIAYAQARQFPKPIYIRALYLYGVNLNKVDLSGANLLHADLAKATLNNADLDNTNLKGANLWKAKLNMSYLNNADMSNAYLQQAVLNKAEMTSTILNKADLTNAKLNQANLTGAFLENSKLRLAELKNADLSQTVLTEADLSGADLEGASLYASTLNEANLGSVAVSTHNGTIVTHVTNLSGSNLFKSILWKSDLNHAMLKNANLRDVDFTDANLERAVLSGADLSNAMLENTNLSYADLSNAKLENTDLYNADLSGARISCEQLNLANNVAFAKIDDTLQCINIEQNQVKDNK